MFRKILIANRGEIAVRIARTARHLWIRSVAVYSDADHNAPHVLACDEAVYIGPAPAAESYLCIDKIIDAMKVTGAEAAHPGYGFLSENGQFATALEAEGLVFIGPTADTIKSMGSKSAAKDLMEAAGVPTTPGYQGTDQSFETFRTEAERIGYPVLLKAAAGGGGKGMRLVTEPAELSDALDSAKREALSAFGDDRFLIEKYITRARHVEVQIFGDGEGNVVHMFERDCSVQRRHQKIIEEAPAPNLPSDVRVKLLKAGVDAGKAVNYRGAGTVEFLYDGNGGVYFMEMNTRLQVEHPVSEMITGQDFVEWQLRIAAGEPLPLAQEDIHEDGHAFEARLYAESPQSDFAPSIGTVSTLKFPTQNVRIDSGVAVDQHISPFYDPMIAKIITHDESRTIALDRMRQALGATYVAGLETNSAFLHALTINDDFRDGSVSTRFIEDHAESLFRKSNTGSLPWMTAVLWCHGSGNDGRSCSQIAGVDGFRLNQPTTEQYWIDHEGEPALLHLQARGDRFDVIVEVDASAAARREKRPPIDPITFSFEGTLNAGGEARLTRDGVSTNIFIAHHQSGIRIWHAGQYTDVEFCDPLQDVEGQKSLGGSLTASMPGVVTLLLVEPDTAVSAGTPLLVMEAMKMEHTIKAPSDGTLQAFRFRPGDQVKDGDQLAEFQPS